MCEIIILKCINNSNINNNNNSNVCNENVY